MDDSMDVLMFNLQEKQFPYFDDEDLELLLATYPDVNEASYEGCLIKAQDDSVKLGPINTPSNQAYWINRAKHFRTKCAKYNGSRGVTMRRADEL